MAESSKELAKRKAELVAQSALLRERLSSEVHSLMTVPELLTKGMEMCKRFRDSKRKPLLIGAAALGLWIIKPRRIVSLILSLTVLLKAWHRFGPGLMLVLHYLLKILRFRRKK